MPRENSGKGEACVASKVMAGRVSTPIAVGLTIMTEELSAAAMTRYPKGDFCSNVSIFRPRLSPSQTGMPFPLQLRVSDCLHYKAV